MPVRQAIMAMVEWRAYKWIIDEAELPRCYAVG